MACRGWGRSTGVLLRGGWGDHAPITGPARQRPHTAKNRAAPLAPAAAGPSRARVLRSHEAPLHDAHIRPHGRCVKPTRMLGKRIPTPNTSREIEHATRHSLHFHAAD